jgi:hypothetical protein
MPTETAHCSLGSLGEAWVCARRSASSLRGTPLGNQLCGGGAVEPRTISSFGNSTFG